MMITRAKNSLTKASLISYALLGTLIVVLAMVMPNSAVTHSGMTAQALASSSSPNGTPWG